MSENSVLGNIDQFQMSVKLSFSAYRSIYSVFLSFYISINLIKNYLYRSMLSVRYKLTGSVHLSC